jgi:hypothetical protein
VNPEIKKILEDMKKRAPDNLGATSDKHTYLSIKNSELLVLLAEENEKSAKELGKHTIMIKFLTWVIVALTFFLVLSVFFEFPKIKIGQYPTLSTEKSAANKSNRDIEALPKGSQTVPDFKK